MARKTKTKRRYKAPMKRRRAAPVRRSAKAKAITTRRRTKRNPKGFFAQPAVRFGIAATIGAGLSTAIDKRQDLRFMKSANNPDGYSASYAAAALTLAVSQFFLKGRNKQLGFAAGVGMLLPAAGPALGEAVNKILPAKNGNGNGGSLKGGTTAGSVKASAYTSRPMLAYSSPAMQSAKFQAVQATTSRMKSA